MGADLTAGVTGGGGFNLTGDGVCRDGKTADVVLRILENFLSRTNSSTRYNKECLIFIHTVNVVNVIRLNESEIIP